MAALAADQDGPSADDLEAEMLAEIQAQEEGQDDAVGGTEEEYQASHQVLLL